ncbi:BQ5605_C027g10314 [Microbotryum silenes-dioicae]|uniref:BQ5605_C027g10314 protein n=1 Tax=Microbotryum silenes-dioicae TaxID=796604 RepID=A0A2X0PMB5_9BASI|nr:BQ5605_C027g10314 [Microbotryum silenes-dioicae]
MASFGHELYKAIPVANLSPVRPSFLYRHFFIKHRSYGTFSTGNGFSCSYGFKMLLRRRESLGLRAALTGFVTPVNLDRSDRWHSAVDRHASTALQDSHHHPIASHPPAQLVGSHPIDGGARA